MKKYFLTIDSDNMAIVQMWDTSIHTNMNNMETVYSGNVKDYVLENFPYIDVLWRQAILVPRPGTCPWDLAIRAMEATKNKTGLS